MYPIIRILPRTLLAVALATLVATAAYAAHNTVTVAVTSSTRDEIAGTVQVKNTVGAAQTGRLTLIVFEVKNDGRVQERGRQDLGIVAVVGLGTTTVPYSVDTSRGPFQKGVFIILADYSSAIGGNPVPHTHCGTFSVTRDF